MPDRTATNLFSQQVQEFVLLSWHTTIKTVSNKVSNKIATVEVTEYE